MKILHCLLTCSLLLAASPMFGEGASPALPPVTRGQRIFAAHHSFFADVPPILNEIAQFAGYPESDATFVGDEMIGGSKSMFFWVIKDKENATKKGLKTGNVDVLALTPVYLPDEGIENFARYGLQYNPNLRVTVQEFWLPFDEYQPHYYDPPLIPQPKTVDHNAPTGAKLREIHAKYFGEMDALIHDVNAKLGKQAVFAVPVGQAVIALREKIIAGQAPGLKTQKDLFSDALGHPTLPLQTLIAYTHFAVIYRRNPAGLPAPTSLALMKLPPDQTDALNRLLQSIAWDAVVHQPLSGVK